MAETRQTRADEIRSERRRQPGSVSHSGMKLGVDEAMLDRKTYEYRWVNDKGARVKQLHDEDWDAVSQPVKADADGVGSVVSKVVGTDEGKPYSGVLMRKRKDWYEQDQKEKQRPLDETDKAIREGFAHAKESPELAGKSYTPGSNSVSR